MLKGQVKQAVLACRKSTRHLPVREKLQAFLAIDADLFSGKPGVKWLKERQRIIEKNLRILDYKPPTYTFLWTPRSERWTNDQRKLKRFYGENPNFKAQCKSEIEKRGGELSIEGNYRTETVDISDLNIDQKLCVMHAEGWRYYSSSHPARYAQLSYFCGIDDSGYFAVRIAGTITHVDAAIDWLVPKAVKKAIEEGKNIIRQGDIYAVECQKQYDGTNSELLDRHEWNPETRILHHPEHQPVKIEFPCRFYRQRAYEMGRSGSKHWAD